MLQESLRRSFTVSRSDFDQVKKYVISKPHIPFLYPIYCTCALHTAWTVKVDRGILFMVKVFKIHLVSIYINTLIDIDNKYASSIRLESRLQAVERRNESSQSGRPRRENLAAYTESRHCNGTLPEPTRRMAIEKA